MLHLIYYSAPNHFSASPFSYDLFIRGQEICSGAQRCHVPVSIPYKVPLNLHAHFGSESMLRLINKSTSSFAAFCIHSFLAIFSRSPFYSISSDSFHHLLLIHTHSLTHIHTHTHTHTHLPYS